MQHLTAKAATVKTEEGTFTAYASAFNNVDRTGERVIKGAFRDTIRRWQSAGRDVPLVWDHGRGAHEVIGSVDSSTMEERDAGLYIEASPDLEDSELAREAWRSVKRGRVLTRCKERIGERRRRTRQELRLDPGEEEDELDDELERLLRSDD